MKKVILNIDGMSCSACSNGLEKYLKKQAGIKDASVNLVMQTASIEYDDNLDIKMIETFVKKAGFNSLGVKTDIKKKKEKITPYILYGLLASFIMYVSMQHIKYLPNLEFLNMRTNPKVYSIVLLFLTIPFLIYGFDILKSGIRNLLNGMPNMDTLVTLGVLSSLIYSIISTVLVLFDNVDYVHNLYFESVVFVIYFIKLGRYIDKNSKEKTKEAIKKLVTITPTFAKLKTSDGYEKVTIDEVKKGDILICYTGDKISVDGIVTEKKAYVDESFITGESKPVMKKKGSKVVAGSVVIDGTLFYKAEKIGKESTISEIVRLVIDATNTKAPIAKYADKISGYFVPIIIIIALLTFIFSLIFGIDLSISLNKFVTVLVVACPCALSLATPLAIVISCGLCAENNILIKKGEVLEIASNIDTIVFDKTGTLTNGKLNVSKIYNYTSKSDNDLMMILALLEKESTHPIAIGIMNYIKDYNIKLNETDNKNSITLSGYGIKKEIGSKTYYAGNRKLVSKLNIENNHLNDEEELLNDENSIVYIIEDDKIIGLIGVKDTIRNESKEVINKLKNMKISPVMLTGDNKKTASKVAEKLGIREVISDVLPSQKREFIKNKQQNGSKVMMIGDGINDAPSLAQADISVTIKSATDIAADTSDVILTNDNLLRIISIINISRKTIKNIKENIFWAFFYNICMIPIAMGLFEKYVVINPMIACIFMIISSLTVIFNALRLKRIKL